MTDFSDLQNLGAAADVAAMVHLLHLVHAGRAAGEDIAPLEKQCHLIFRRMDERRCLVLACWAFAGATVGDDEKVDRLLGIDERIAGTFDNWF